MKYALFIALMFCSLIPFAQVPERPSGGGDGGWDVAPVAPDFNSHQAGTYQQDGKYGFVYPSNTRQEAVYDYIGYAQKAFIVRKGGLYGIANLKGSLTTKLEYDTIYALSEYYGLSHNYVVCKNGKYGQLSPEGTVVLPVKYNKIEGENNDVLLTAGKNGAMQLIFKATKNTLPQYITSVDLYHNLAVVKSQGKFGVVRGNKLIVPFEYDSIVYNITKGNNVPASRSPIRNMGLVAPNLIVMKNGKIGMIDAEGATVYPVECDMIARADMQYYYLAKKGTLFSIYFLSADKKTPFEYERVYTDGYGYVMAVKNNKSGAYKMNGELVVPFEYDNASINQYSGIGLRVTKDKKKGVIDPDGNMIVPAIYDDVSTLYASGFERFLQVKSDGRSGVVNLKGEVVIPVIFGWVGTKKDYFMVQNPEPDNTIGLYDKEGKVVVPAEYQWITTSATGAGKLMILKKEDESFNFLNAKNELILQEHVSDYGYVLNQHNLLNPFSSTKHYLLYLKNKKGKFGMLNEMTGTLDIPMMYDNILQRFENKGHIYYSVQKGKKYGLINEKNEVVIPFVYDDICLDFVSAGGFDDTCQIVVAKGRSYGTVNLQNEIQIPFQYSDLKRLSVIAIFKAKKKGKQYRIINAKNEPITNDFFDEVANFEYDRQQPYESEIMRVITALTFTNDKMRVIDGKGNYLTEPIEMHIHQGYKTFDELKQALVEALNSKDDILLKDFVDKIAPSEHILYYLKQNMFSDKPLESIDIAYVKEKYYNNLLKFKRSYWGSASSLIYNKASLTDVTDYTLYKDGFVTNRRNTDHAFGDAQYMEKFLRNAVKINGFWISTYFMKRYF